MTGLRRLLLAALVAAGLACGAGAAPALAQDTAAVAVNTKDGSSLFKFAFQVRRTMKDVVDASNAAVAVASCNGCRTVAVSFEIVLVGGSPSTVTPTNLALAMNVDCTSCDTLAAAYQWVIGTGDQVRFTPEGQRRMNEIRKRLRELEKQELTDEQLMAELDRAAADIADVLKTELVPVGKPADTGGGGERAPPDTTETPTPSPTPAASPTETPTPTPSPSPSPTATATPSTTATP